MEDTRRRVLEAAGQEFAEKGLNGASIRSICARAKANVAAVNYYFGDKESLYVQAVMEAHRCGVIQPPDLDPVEREPAEQLRDYIRHFLNGIIAVDQSEGWHHDLLLRELVRPSTASETLVREVIRPRFEALKALVGRICPEAEERRRHAIVFSIIGQCLHYRMARRMGARLLGVEEMAAMIDLEFLTGHIAGFTLAALGLGPPLDAAGVAGPEPERVETGEGPCAGSL